MEKRSRRKFAKEFKAETVALIRRSGKSIAEVCREMGLPESSVHRWLAQAEIDVGQRDGLTTAEREELSRVRQARRPQAVVSSIQPVQAGEDLATVHSSTTLANDTRPARRRVHHEPPVSTR